jgi:carbon-monoxide dehydrogenase small subunit
MSVAVELTLNGRPCRVEVEPHWTVIDLLRDRLDLTGTKGGCGEGVCGTCTVLVDGEPARACLMLAAHLRGRSLVTVEGLERDGRLHPLQEAFARHGAAQCGYCTPGMLMAAAALLARRREVSDREVREALSGNLCRCTGYQKIVEAVRAAASASAAAAVPGA